jgi:tetratricopeptide (TPR) repeat protein
MSAAMKNDDIEELLNKALDLMADFRDDEGEEEINALIQRLKADMDATVGDADRYYYWGRGLSLLEEPEQALLRFEKALQIKPDHEGALWETVTLLLYELERPEGAKAVLVETLLPLRPGYELYEEALAAAHTLIRLQKGKATSKNDAETEPEFPESGSDSESDSESEPPGD